MTHLFLIITFLLSTPFSHASAFPQETTLSFPNTHEAKNISLNPRAQGWSPGVALQDSQGVCPQWAYINCQSITSANYCCGQGTYCAYGGPENHIGCCADSDVCVGYPPAASTTVRVPSATGTTWWTQSGTTVTGLIGPAYTVTVTEYVTGPAPTICSTLYAKGDNLPTTAAAQCGLVLVLNDAPARQVDGVTVVGLAIVHGLIAVLGWIGLL